MWCVRNCFLNEHMRMPDTNFLFYIYTTATWIGSFESKALTNWFDWEFFDLLSEGE